MIQVVKLRERSSCALHETKKIPGDSNRRGSSAAEQNHSSVVSLFFGDKETKDCMEHVNVIIRYLFTRQKTHTNKFNKGLFGLCNKRATCLEKLEEGKTITNQNGIFCKMFTNIPILSQLHLQNYLVCDPINIFKDSAVRIDECRHHQV